MKTTVKLLGAVILGAELFISGCAKKQTSEWQSIKNPEVATQLKSFVTEKEAQANAATNKMPKEFKRFFAAADRGDWLVVSNMFYDLGRRNGHFETAGKPEWQLRGIPWQAVAEIWGGFAAFGEGDEKYSAAYANDIIDSIPPGSIYFGGTDPGRFLITAMQKSQVKGDPFFTLTQNALCDGSYLDYLRSMYGGRIYIPTSEDSQKCFQDYMEDAQRRMQNHQLKPGEDVRTDANGKIQVSGQVAVMNINGLLVKTIFDKTPDREFYIEESFPLDWMYPYLEPHSLIMKINRQPLPALSEAVVSQDHDYWAKYVQPMIGDWLKADTSVEEVAAFAEKVFAKNDFNGFTGDPRFIQNAYSHKMFSKLRSSQAGLYAWRAQHAADASEKERMNEAADFAFRQAFALCPYSPEAVFRYVNLLFSEKRLADAVTVAETAVKMPAIYSSDGEQFRSLARQLQNYQKANQTSPDGK
ncbi:MAG: hypothetical protein WAO02_17950 [Verrucomicrobiia bacterium]